MATSVRTALLALAPVMALAAGLWLGWAANTFLAEDACLDRGGAWAASLRACDVGDR